MDAHIPPSETIPSHGIDVNFNTKYVKENAELPSFLNYNDLVSESVGGKIIFSTDDFFAVAENLLKAGDAVWREGEYTDFGKWMDGWETRRKRKPGHDWCIIELGCAGQIYGAEISTKHFTGNYAPKISIQGTNLTQKLTQRLGDRMGTEASEEDLDRIRVLDSEDWEHLVEMSDLKSGHQETHRSFFAIHSIKKITHIRLNIFPDGGVARLRLYGLVKPDWSNISNTNFMDLVSMVNGGTCICFSNAHYGHASNVIAPGRSKRMDQGWETARKKDRPAVLTDALLKTYGGEWAIYRFGHAGVVDSVEIDTSHFKGNFPHSFTLEDELGEDVRTTDEQIDGAEWKPVLNQYELKGHQIHKYGRELLHNIGTINHVRLTIYPDGGVARMVLMGRIVKQ